MERKGRRLAAILIVRYFDLNAAGGAGSGGRTGNLSRSKRQTIRQASANNLEVVHSAAAAHTAAQIQDFPAVLNTNRLIGQFDYTSVFLFCFQIKEAAAAPLERRFGGLILKFAPIQRFTGRITKDAITKKAILCAVGGLDCLPELC